MSTGTERDYGQEDPEESKKLHPIKDLANQVSLSERRIRELLNEGKIEGELHSDEGYGKGLWYTSVEAIEQYENNLWTPQEWGRKGGLIAGRGRPKTS